MIAGTSFDFVDHVLEMDAARSLDFLQLGTELRFGDGLLRPGKQIW
jgi:hypothetical protein